MDPMGYCMVEKRYKKKKHGDFQCQPSQISYINQGFGAVVNFILTNEANVMVDIVVTVYIQYIVIQTMVCLYMIQFDWSEN